MLKYYHFDYLFHHQISVKLDFIYFKQRQNDYGVGILNSSASYINCYWV